MSVGPYWAHDGRIWAGPDSELPPSQQIGGSFYRSVTRNNIKSIRISFLNVELPHSDFIERYDAYVPGVVDLYEYGISLLDVQAAFKWLYLEVPKQG